MPITVVSVPITTSATGAGTGSVRQIRGEIVKVMVGTPGTALTTGGSADMTITHQPTGGTVLSVTNISAGQVVQYQPRDGYHSVTGTLLGTADVGVSVAGSVSVVIAQGALSQSGTVHLYVRI